MEFFRTFPISLVSQRFFDFNAVEKPVENVDNFSLLRKNLCLYTNYVNFTRDFQKDICPLLSIYSIFHLQTCPPSMLHVDKLMKLCTTPMVFPFHTQGSRGFPVYKSVQTVENPVKPGVILPVIDRCFPF